MNRNELNIFFPDRYRNIWTDVELEWDCIEEIRLRINRKIVYKVRGREKELSTDGSNVDEKMLEAVFKQICHDSVYAYEEEKKHGYITVKGGHRVGIAGEVYKDEQGQNYIKYVRYINIRFAHEMKGISKHIIPYIFDGERFMNTIIISPPGVGKTTLLRDIVRHISDIWEGINIGLVDEKNEITGSYRGEAMLDCGKRTDVIIGGNKAYDINIFVRFFSPRIIVTDEIGKKEDIESLINAYICGCNILTTIHGRSVIDISQNKEVKRMMELNMIDRYLLLSVDEKNIRWVYVLDQEDNLLCYTKL